MIEATLRLFRAVQVSKAERVKTKKFPSVLRDTITSGYVIDPGIPHTEKVLRTIEKIIGLSGRQANAAFHKSWAIVRDTPMETLLIQQLVHYITTYGFEDLGIYSNDTVYVPTEKLAIPGVTEDIPLIVVRALTREEIRKKIITLAGSGIALSQEVLDDLLWIIEENDYDNGIVLGIKNRELKILLYDLFGTAPKDPEEFLRYAVYKLTGETLIIKNEDLIGKLKAADGRLVYRLMRRAPENLASVFFRFKPLFLAMKKASPDKPTVAGMFNRLRKRANKLHRPMPEDYLGNVTGRIKHRALDTDILEEELDKANIFRKIRLANALSYRLDRPGSIVYRVRNGKGYASELDLSHGTVKATRSALAQVRESIAEDLYASVNGTTVYIPKYMHYTLPATEKQFTGNFPTGTFIELPGDVIFGIHWCDTDRRIDLDLSVLSESGKVGWDTTYRTSDLTVLFSGDMTSAPKPDGASELFYFNGILKEPRLIYVNFYNFNGDSVPCSLFVAQHKVDDLHKDYVVNPNDILARAEINITRRQNILGLIYPNGTKSRVCFAEMSIGNSITSEECEDAQWTREYMIHSVRSSLKLREILKDAGATIVSKKTKPREIDYDLSPESLDKTTFMDLLTNGGK